MRQHYLIGEYLNNRYIIKEKLLSPEYNESEIIIYSTPVSRTLISAQSQAFGLYKPHWSQNFSVSPSLASNNFSSINFNSVPIRTDEYLKKMLLSEMICKQYSNYTVQRKKEKSIQNIYQAYGDVLIPISIYFNLTISKSQEIASKVYDSIVSNKFKNYEYPQIFDDKWFKRAENLYVRLKVFQRYEPDHLARFSASEFFLELLSQFDSKISGILQRKATIYSAHDTSLMNIFATFGIKFDQQPPFASVLLFELMSENFQMFVRIIYNGDEVFVPGFDRTCSFEEFKNYIFSRVFVYVDQACETIDFVAKNKTFVQENIESGMNSLVFINLFILAGFMINVFIISKNSKFWYD